MFMTGKGLEAAGLAVVAAGLVFSVVDEKGLKMMTQLFALGGAIFAVGWLMERGHRPGS
jgi:hypothetical protein